MQRIQKTLDCRNIYDLNYDHYDWKPHAKLKVNKINDIRLKLIPFFKKYPLQAKKKINFNLFCKAAKIFEKKEPLTLKGIKELRKLQKKMNKFGK